MVLLGACEGPAGPAGSMGTMGAMGLSGTMGAVGTMGAKGDPGTPGQDGTNTGTPGTPGKDGTNGTNGVDGKDGTNGTNGTNGTDATPTKITATIGCFGSLEGSIYNISYWARQFSDGFVFSSGSVAGPEVQSSAANFFAPQQNGYDTAAVQMTLDVIGADNYGYWTISLNRATLVTTIVNTDIDVAGGSRSWTMTPDKCVVNTY